MKRAGGKSVSLLIVICLFLAGFAEKGCRDFPQKISICELQGLGRESLFQGREVIIQALVSADLVDLEPGGFAVIDEVCPAAEGGSGGVIVSLEAGGDLVNPGDEIQVRGIVREVDGETRLASSPEGLEILSINHPLPDPLTWMDLFQSPINFSYENWEGRLIFLPAAEILATPGPFARVLVAPRIDLEPASQLVCFQGPTLELELSLALLESRLGQLRMGETLENLVGLIREDQNGYYLELIEKPHLILEGQVAQSGEVFPAGRAESQGSTPSQTFTPRASRTPLPSSTPTPSQTASPTLVPTPTLIPTPTYYPVHLLISEFLPNPQGEEPGGEWIEIYNPGGSEVPLDGVKIGDETSPAGKEGMLRFPNGYTIGEGEVRVIANRARVFEAWYGFIPDFELVDSDPRVPDLLPYDPWGRNLVKLSNSGDEVLLVDPWDEVVDLVAYGNSNSSVFSPAVPAPDEGHSLERYPPDQDLGQAGDWREKVSPSPGELDLVRPTESATWTSTSTGGPNQTPTEPSVTPENSLTPAPWTATSSPSASSTSTEFLLPTIPLTPSATSLPGPTRTPLPGATPSQTPNSIPTGSVTPVLTNTVLPSQTQLSSPSPIPTGTLADTPALTLESTPSPTMTPAGSPTGLSASATSIPAPSASMLPSATGGTTPAITGTWTPVFTPTNEFPLTSTPGLKVVINEIHADPDPLLGDSNGDGEVSWDDDEFLELVNISGGELDLSSWTVSDQIRLRYTFPDGTILSSGCGVVLFGGGDPVGEFGGSLVFEAGSLGLNNTGDIVTLRDSEGVEVTRVSYGEEGNQNQSLTRDPDLFGPLPLVLHSQVPGSAGALFSPGTSVDLVPLGTCP